MAERPLEGKVAVVTGSSRGIGKQISIHLAEAGANIIGNSVDPRKGKRVDETIGEIQARGVEVEWVIADIATPEGRARLIHAGTELASRVNPNPLGGIDYLILNAAGGLETDRPEGWAYRINVESQLALVGEARPLMEHNGAVVNITSLWSERFGEAEQLPFYRPIAKTKHLAERRLRELIPDLENDGLRLAFVCGNLIRGTGAYTLFSRSYPELVNKLRGKYQSQTGQGDFPEAEDMGRAVVDLLSLGKFRSGITTYVGNMELDPIPTHQKYSYELNRAQISDQLPMYGTKAPYNKLYVDRFVSPEEDNLGDAKETGIGYYTIRRADTAGHFTGPLRNLRLYRGVDQEEMAAQVGGLVLLGLESGTGMVPLLIGLEGRKKYTRMLIPGDTVEIQAVVTNLNPQNTRVNAGVYLEGKLASEFQGLTFALAPSLDYVRKIMAYQRSSK